MSTEPYDDILKKIDELSEDQKQRLLEQLRSETLNRNRNFSGRTLFDVFKDDGMLGSITDAPADWSSNPEYMKGFGEDG